MVRKGMRHGEKQEQPGLTGEVGRDESVGDK